MNRKPLTAGIAQALALTALTTSLSAQVVIDFTTMNPRNLADLNITVAAQGITFLEPTAPGTISIGASNVGFLMEGNGSAPNFTMNFNIPGQKVTGVSVNYMENSTHGLSAYSATFNHADAFSGSPAAERAFLGLNSMTSGSPTSLSGLSDGVLTATITGQGVFTGIASITLTLEPTPVPEPATYSAIFGMLALAGAVGRRHMQKTAAAKA